MLERLRAMPPGVLVFLGYAFMILGIIGVSLRYVIDQAISAPVSLPGVAVMALLAYTIFTVTLVLQRKEAARGLALGLAFLTIPTAVILIGAGFLVPGFIVAGLAVVLFRGLTRPAVRAYLDEP